MIEIKKDLWTSDVRRLLIKLGGSCNIKCPHCHSNSDEFEFNPDLIRWIKAQPDLERITFNGGEPLMYIGEMKRIVDELDGEYRISMVSNGTLLTDDIVDWMNDNDIEYGVSFDGISDHGGRDASLSIRWDLIRNLKRVRMSSYMSGSGDIFDLQDDVATIKEAFNVRSIKGGDDINQCFIHEVESAPNATESMNDVKRYLEAYSRFVELQIIKQKMIGTGRDMFALRHAVNTWLTKKKYSWGVQCSNQFKLTVALDGRFLKCPYASKYYGNIYDGYDIEKEESEIPPKCRKCPIREYCRNTCIENKTSHECVIARKMHEFLKRMEEKHGIDLVSFYESEIPI